MAIERGVQKRPWWWPFHRELFWPLRYRRDDAKAGNAQTLSQLLPEKLIEKAA
jgi:hypothetical protein